MFRSILLLFFILLFSISCGLPDVTGISQEINQPIITKVVPGNNQVTVYFDAQNNEPAFSGYNIYFGDNLNRRKYTLYNQQKNRPTLIEVKTTTVQSYSYTIKVGEYYSTNGNDVNTLTTTDIQNGVPIYVFVSAYQITPSAESSYFDDFSKMATPRPEELNKTISVNGKITGTRDIVELVNGNGNGNGKLEFKNTANGSIMRVAGDSLDDVVIPPEQGYSTANIDVVANRLYLVKNTEGGDSYYSKIFVRSVNGTSSIVVDYAYQISANILSY